MKRKNVINTIINLMKPNWIQIKTEDENVKNKVKAEPLSQLLYMPPWWKAMKKRISAKAVKGTLGSISYVFLMNIVLIPVGIIVWLISQMLLTQQHNKKLKDNGEPVFGSVAIPAMMICLSVLLIVCLAGYKTEGNPNSIENKFNATVNNTGVVNDPNSTDFNIPVKDIDLNTYLNPTTMGPQQPPKIVISQNAVVEDYDNLIVSEDTTSTTLAIDDTFVRKVVVE